VTGRQPAVGEQRRDGLLAAQRRRADDLGQRHPGEPLDHPRGLGPARLVELHAGGAPGQHAGRVRRRAPVAQQDQGGHEQRAYVRGRQIAASHRAERGEQQHAPERDPVPDEQVDAVVLDVAQQPGDRRVAHAEGDDGGHGHLQAARAAGSSTSGSSNSPEATTAGMASRNDSARRRAGQPEEQARGDRPAGPGHAGISASAWASPWTPCAPSRAPGRPSCPTSLGDVPAAAEHDQRRRDQPEVARHVSIWSLAAAEKLIGSVPRITSQAAGTPARRAPRGA
jgi:hypothetical protein